MINRRLAFQLLSGIAATQTVKAQDSRVTGPFCWGRTKDGEDVYVPCHSVDSPSRKSVMIDLTGVEVICVSLGPKTLKIRPDDFMASLQE